MKKMKQTMINIIAPTILSSNNNNNNNNNNDDDDDKNVLLARVHKCHQWHYHSIHLQFLYLQLFPLMLQ